jgi:dihydroorotate dehydrogenase
MKTDFLGLTSKNPIITAAGPWSRDGESIRRNIASVASLAQTVDIPVCGIGGIDSYEGALEYIMLGASSVQVGTALMLKGRSYVKKIADDLSSKDMTCARVLVHTER